MPTDQPREPQTYTDEFMAEYVRNHRCHSALRDVSIADWDRGVRVIQTNAAVAEEPTTIALPDDPAQDPQLGAARRPAGMTTARARLATGRRAHVPTEMLRGMELPGWAVIRTACGRTGAAYFPGAKELPPCQHCTARLTAGGTP